MSSAFRRLLPGLVLGLATLAAQPSAAAPACATALVEGGIAINHVTPLSDLDRDTLLSGLHSALNDPTGRYDWPDPQVAAAPSCEVGVFEADGASWTLTGGRAPAPVRWAKAPGRSDYLFLAAGAGLGARQTFYLVGVNGENHYVFRAYLGAPDQAALIEDMKRLLTGQLSPLAIYDRPGEAITLVPATASGAQAQIFGTGAQPASIYGADGHFFGDADDGGYQMRGSGFVCRRALGGQQRSRLIVVNRNDTQLDLGCGFNGVRSWMTIFVTRIPDPGPMQGVFDQRTRDALRSTGVSGAPENLPLAMEFGQTWTDPRGVRQGLWIIRQGRYVVESRATFAPADQPAIETAVSQLAADVKALIPSAGR